MALKYQRHLIKYFTIIFCLLHFSHGKAQYVMIPDTNFVNWLDTSGYQNCLSGNMLDTTCPQVLSTSFIDCSNSNIQDLSGVQYFNGTFTLICANNALTFLPALPPLLTYFDFSYNSVAPPFVLPNSLQYLNCSQNQMDSLPSLPASLIWIDCSYNMLDSLPALPFSLNKLFCEGNYIDTLPALPPSLTWMDCSTNRIYDLPDLPDSMYEFYCGNNPLLCLPQLNTIVNLDFSGTSVACFPDSGNVTNSNPPLSSLTLCSVSNPSGCSFPSAIRTIQTSAIQLFPNPASTYAILNTGPQISETLVRLLDATGRELREIPVTDHISRMDVSDLSPGLYFVKVSDTQGGVEVKKLVVQ